jgi:CheY-like chemotaxis protein/HPt (histidine-containing phosphotransfer) domain-containing protein
MRAETETLDREQSAVPPATAPAARVLVADDSVMNQKVIAAMLAKLGHRADVVGNGREAVDAVEALAYDLVLMDCQMPEMDGFEATRAIRERERPGAPRVAIVALTASAMPGDRERCLAAGMDDYLAKPVTRQALQAMVDRWLSAAPAPAGDPAAGDPGVDPELVAELRELAEGEGPAFLTGLLGSFVAEGRKRVEALRETVKGDDRRAVLQLAHALKGSAANLGACRLASLSGGLEAAARKSIEADAGGTGSAAPWTGCVEEIAAEFDRVCPRLEVLFGIRAA